jgi:putative transposase
MIKSAKFRIYPTASQREQIAKTMGCARKMWNDLLNEQNRIDKQRLAGNTDERLLTHFDMIHQIVAWKKENELAFLKEADSYALQQTAINLNTAIQNYFKSRTGKRKGAKMGWPVFKNRHSKQTYRTMNINGVVRLTERTIHLPKLSYVRCIIDRPLESDAKIKSVTVSLDRDGRYYAAVCYETATTKLLPMTGREVGIDLGLKDLFITSDGQKMPSPRDLTHVAKTKRQIKQKQKQLARKERGSRNWERTRLQLARLFSRAARQRRDYYHKLSHWLVNSYDAIYLEDLNVNGMMKNRSLSRAIHESAWSELADMIAYKADWSGKSVHKISRWFPSSKTCSCCNHRMDSIPLSVRTWTCPACKTTHCRDINAAINILLEGQKDLYGTSLVRREAEVISLPAALMKIVDKSERTRSSDLVDDGMELISALLR